MENDSQKTALAKSLKAEEKKVMTKQRATPTNKNTSKPSRGEKVTVIKPIKKIARTAKSESKHHKQKTIRDSFTMPENEYKVLAELKKKCLASGVGVKKSELLRAGLKSLSEMSLGTLKKQLSKLDEIKIGRPANPSKSK